MNRPLNLFLTLVLSVAIATVTGCSDRTTQTVNPTPTSSTQTPSTQISAPSQLPRQLTEKVKFKLDGETEAFSLKPKDDGAKLEDPNGQELARLTVDEGGKVKIKNAADTVLGYVVTMDGYWKVESADQKEELFILRQQPDGDYKLERGGSDEEVYRIKAREYGYEIETPDKQSLYKIKSKDGKLSLQDATDKTALYTNSAFPTIAVACFGFDMLSREQQAALAYAVYQSGGQ